MSTAAMAKPRMTRNEYWNWIREDVSRITSGEADEIEIIPLDLERFTKIKPENKTRIDKWFNEEAESEEGEYLLFSRSYHPYDEIALLGMEMGEGNNGYSWWAYDDEQMMIYTYCEGDTSIKLFESEERYLNKKIETEEWYIKQFA